MKKPSTQETGRRGEDIAVAFLRKKGYEVVQRNFRYRRAEIDLIMQKDSLLVFVEVKTRRDSAYGFPETFVSPEQAQLIVAAADHYVREQQWEGMIRFDIVAITLTPALKVEHFEDAFY
ncbi:MAG: YraN family protein [Cyclobacteriaceae bacterium]